MACCNACEQLLTCCTETGPGGTPPGLPGEQEGIFLVSPFMAIDGTVPEVSVPIPMEGFNRAVLTVRVVRFNGAGGACVTLDESNDGVSWKQPTLTFNNLNGLGILLVSLNDLAFRFIRIRYIPFSTQVVFSTVAHRYRR